MGLNNYNDIELFNKEIDLPVIKYTEHNKFIIQDSKLSNYEVNCFAFCFFSIDSSN